MGTGRKSPMERLDTKIVVNLTRGISDRLDQHCTDEGIPIGTYVRGLIQAAIDDRYVGSDEHGDMGVGAVNPIGPGEVL